MNTSQPLHTHAIDVDALLEEIAKRELHIPTLNTQSSDGLDFHDVSVWGLKSALLKAFEPGRTLSRDSGSV